MSNPDAPTKFGWCQAGQCHGTVTAKACPGEVGKLRCGCDCHGFTFPAWSGHTLVMRAGTVEVAQVRTRRDGAYVKRHGGTIYATAADAVKAAARVTSPVVDRSIVVGGLPVVVLA